MSIKVKLKQCDGECGNPQAHIWKQHENKRFCKNCWFKIKPLTPLKQSSIIKTQKPIAKRSDKRKKQEVLYSVLSKNFLKNHPECQAKISLECRGLSSECHHKFGRIGDLLCDDSKFLAVCSACHHHIENNREEAIKLGFSGLRTV